LSRFERPNRVACVVARHVRRRRGIGTCDHLVTATGKENP
jgi:hypothetical protein